MNDNTTVNPTQKVFVNLSLILLGICANGPFFYGMITLLMGTAILGFLRSQQKQFTLNSPQVVQEEEKIPVTRLQK